MEFPGLLDWANSVRLTMATDPGRQLFKEQVQTHGFLFLDDYLDNILSGARQDPLIELVKTPGRKKAIMRKPKLLSSNLGNVFTLEDSNENTAPKNSLQQTLALHKPPAVGQSNQLEVSTGSKGKASSRPHEPVSRLPFAPMQTIVVPDEDHEEDAIDDWSAHPESRPGELVAPTSEPHELSVIAEGDESPERPRPLQPAPVAGERQLPTPPLKETALSSGQRAFPSMDTRPAEPPSPSSTFPKEPVPAPQVPVIVDVSLLVPSSPAKSLHVAPDHPAEDRAPSLDHEMDEVDENILEELNKEDKTGVLLFPTLPEPAPLRKSMKHPPQAAVMLGAATPGAPGGGKRSLSWLAMAREVKARETTTKKSDQHTSPPPASKKRKSLEIIDGTQPDNNTNRQSKSLKRNDGDTASSSSRDSNRVSDIKMAEPEPVLSRPQSRQSRNQDSEEGVLDQLKKTVEGFGSRLSKNVSKSIGESAASSLAQAKAAAEAKIYERDLNDGTVAIPVDSVKGKDLPSPTHQSSDNDRSLRVSDLFPKDMPMKEKHKVPERVFTLKPDPQRLADGPKPATTLVPPPVASASQPSAFTLLGGPVFTKPSVFVPPPHQLPPVPPVEKPPVFSNPAALGLGPRPLVFGSPPRSEVFKPKPPAPAPAPLTAHSTLESVKSDTIFDRPSDVRPAWMPGTQDTDYTDNFDNHPMDSQPQICDEDDSWPIDEKISAGVQWTFGAKDDSMTWSTLYQSQREESGPIATSSSNRIEPPSKESTRSSKVPVPGAFVEDEPMPEDEDMAPVADSDPVLENDDELEEIVLNSKPSSQSAVEHKGLPRSQSQISLASSSTQNHTGFFGQATKLISNALGSTKKKQPEVSKVMQQAAAALKKQQEEADKKAARMKEMEARRQQALQRKAEEEKARAQEEERKRKEEAERRKKEREEHTDKRPLKPVLVKKDDTTAKKGKEPEKAAESKKPVATKLPLKSALKPPQAGPPADHKAKTQPPTMPMDDDITQPSMLLQGQMAARARAQLDLAKQKTEPPLPPSESIELPDIASDYGSDDGRDPPDWAQSPELAEALKNQATINPDDIFGAVGPLRMEEVFKTKTSRFRNRSSSANWTGADRLTVQEEREYARRMGFR